MLKGLSRSKFKWWAIDNNLSVNVLVRLLHPQIWSMWYKTLLAPSSNKQTSNYDTGCSKHHSSILTVRPRRLSQSKMKWWAIYTNLPLNAIVRVPYPRIGYTWREQTILAISAYNQTCNYDTECSSYHPSLSILRPRWLSCSNMKW